MSGVKGMRWGVRKKRKYPVGPVKTAAGGTFSSPGHFGPSGPGTGHRNYDINKLDNASLQKVINRMALEKRYNELNHRKPEPDPVKQFIDNAVKSNLNSALNASVSHVVKLMLNKKLPPPKNHFK